MPVSLPPRWSLVLLIAFLPATGWSAEPAGYQPGYDRLSSGSWVQDKNFYLLTLFEQIPAVRAELAAEPDLAAMNRARGRDAVKSDFKTAVETLTFSDRDIAIVRETLERRFAQSPALQGLVTGHLRPSGCYIRLAGRTDAEMLGAAWVEAAKGVNRIIRQFAFGTDVLYPTGIDSPSFDPESLAYQEKVLAAASTATKPIPPRAAGLFFRPSLTFALELMALNQRDEPARLEPLAKGENRAAIDAARHLDWSQHPYAALLVCGIGPDTPGVPISEGSRANCAAAAQLYRDGAAPLIIVSGGYVHPKQTPFCEAVEMKRELMQVHGIPESAILLDPQARHHTTNLRNAARLLFALAAPADKPSLAISQPKHITGIMSDRFRQRSLEAFGYVPARFGRKIDATSVEFFPSIESLHIEPRDPLDP